MKKVLLAVGLLVCALTLGGNSSTKSVMAQGEPTSLRGHVYGILTIPAEEIAKMPDGAKDERFSREMVTDLENGGREVKTGISGWTVKVGKKAVITNENGEFELSNLRMHKKMYLLLSFNGEEVLKQHIWLEEGEDNIQDVVIMQDINNMIKRMGIGVDEEMHQSSSHVPCNKSNYYCVGTVNSDCYKNLAGGNPYCWAELLKLSWPPRWCNGDRNCSRFIGHRQESHCDYYPW